MSENSEKGSSISSSTTSRSPSVSAAVTPSTLEEVEESDLSKVGPPPQKPPPSSSGSFSQEDYKPSFNYDLEVFNLCKEYLNTRNHHGLALIARQKGIPPFLRFKVWPILLKSHPFVINPFIQPDQDLMKESSSSSTSSSTTATTDNSPVNSAHSSIKDGVVMQESDTEEPPSDPHEEIKRKIKRDLGKYIQRLKYSQSKYTVGEMEHQILSILEDSILKFILKWGKIIKYDLSLTWIALNLAEWFPPVPKTPWVLVGRDYSNADSLLIINVMDDYSNYIDNIPDLKNYIENLIYSDEKVSNMSFREVYERLVLVLLHCPEPESRKKKSEALKNASDLEQAQLQPLKVNKTTLPKTGGTIEERVSYFIYCLRKLLPELSQYFHEEQILTKFGCLDDEWLIWWLKFCGTKVWSKYDRGRIWDFMMGWRLKNPRRDFNYYYEKLNYVNRNTLEKLGPDIFWSVGSEEENEADMCLDDHSLSKDKKTSSFKDLINDLNNDLHVSKKSSAVPDRLDRPHLARMDSSPNFSIPFSRVDPHIALIFISLSLLKSKENTLVELDQHEIRQFLSRLPSKSYKYKLKKNTNSTGQKRMSSSSNSSSNSTSPLVLPLNLHNGNEDPILLPTSRIIISNDSNVDHKHKVNFIDNIILESGELWRKWLWLEMIDDN
ncbi:Oxidant-induced cell-cycle arrest protein 5 [Candida viswanathii]|uniref:Oxidant-induced cell-cycle arrest protein 5 n=1 Tax=Candida viswanathii TaxID=5486 RepID=A0A367XVA4_9ASCO|nr:Oxidant-induced cell-cycle arrest protein 5 [Candida viswanathii]